MDLGAASATREISRFATVARAVRAVDGCVEKLW
jgi:hypothetical protein